MQLRSALSALADLVLPRACLGCGRPVTAWCTACRPRGDPFLVAGGGLDVRAAARYDGAVRVALLSYKERARIDLAAPLGALLARAVTAARPVAASGASTARAGGVVLVPVPSSRAAARARGGDHLQRLARIAGRHSGAPVNDVLRLSRLVADSAGLSRADRARNLSGAMRAGAPGTVREALVVDDILTSGATVREARRALAAAGWQVRGAAVVAFTPRHARSPATAGTFSRGRLPLA